MTIKTRLKISSLVYVAVTVGVGLVLLVGLQSLSRDLERAKTNYTVVKGLMELTTLIEDYLVHAEKRALKQWQTKHSTIGNLLQNRDLESSDLETTGRLIKDHEENESLFSQVISIQDKIRSGELESKTSAELRDRLTGMLLMQMQSMVSDASQLYLAGQARIDSLLVRLMWVMMFFVAVTASIILGNHFLTRNTLIMPLTKLAKDTEIIGRGNLDHVVEIESHDEMGQLAQSFNVMTAELKKSYDALEAEIRERKQAQEELKRHRDHLEELVEERTQGLGMANENLRAEIQERKRVDLSLQKEMYISEMTLDSLPGIFYLFDDQGKFLRWNRNFEEVSGYSAEEISQMHPLNFFRGDDLRVLEEAIGLVFVKGENEVEADFVSKNEVKTPYFLTGVRITLDDTPCLLGTGLDITERKRAESALARYVKELERTNAELEEFAYISSHHLQEPLRKVINFSELLVSRYEGQLNEQARRYLAYVIDGAMRMRALIEDLLVYTRLDRYEPSCDKINLNEMIRTILSDLDSGIRSVNAVVTLDDLPYVAADAREMRMLFENLVSNAIKFHREEAPHVHISAKKDNNAWVFSVRDNGLGIDPAYADQIFGIFQLLHPAGKYPGTGIGLALCKKIVERHGGHIWVESEPGKGSVFYFTIPETGGERLPKSPK
jgi:PAS domain S-box-containing protein